VGLAVLANALWSAVPVYFKLLGSVPSQEILLHRVVWCALLLWLGVIITGRTALVIEVLRSPGALAALGGTALLLAVDWWAYLHAVTTGQLLQASFGYFLAPLVNVLLGVGFFRERLRPAQWLAVGLASVGVLYLCLSMDFPRVGLEIAANFALYAAARKRVAVNEVAGLLVETTVLLPVGVSLLLVLHGDGRLNFGAQPGTSFALVLSGAVTAAPLLAHVAALRRLPLSTSGVLQYLAPTIQFLLAVFLFAEPLSGSQVVSFILVRAAVLIHTLQPLRSGLAVRAGLTTRCPHGRLSSGRGRSPLRRPSPSSACRNEQPNRNKQVGRDRIGIPEVGPTG
jgi:chloramphenicol-sensitive protein RarD